MKVVLFCGGLGTRLREHSDTIPKPLVPVGPRPILWHLMKYYAHFGHKDFILCLGYKGDLIKDFFLNYKPYTATDFVMHDGGKTMEPEQSDIHDWTIRFVDTGLHSNIGERLVQVRRYVQDDEVFLANYSDQLTDFPLNDYIERFRQSQAVASFLAVRPSQTFHDAQIDDDGYVTCFQHVSGSDFWINGGYIVLRREIFDYIQPGEELVDEPYQRLIKERRLIAHKYRGFWAAMDTFKDKIRYDRMHGRGECPWEVWNHKEEN